jgi:hypothetical protein
MRSLDPLGLNTYDFSVCLTIGVGFGWLWLLWPAWDLGLVGELGLDWFLVFFKCTVICKPSPKRE